jgi:hypothetical protein
MPQFDLSSYETVEERLKRFWATKGNEDARIVTINHTTPQDRQVSTWVVEARIYLNRADQLDDLPKATGWAFEVDGVGMAQKAAALETCETSAIGRCLGNMDYSGNKRTTREEMAKAARGVTPKPQRDYKAEIEKLADIETARQLYNEARTSKAPAEVLEAIKTKVDTFASPTK